MAESLVETPLLETPLASLHRELGGKMVQGYYFSRPMEETDIAGFLADRARPEPMLRSG